MKKKILILGSSGTLGNSLVKILKKKYNVFHNGLIKRKINFNSKNKLAKLIKKTNPNLIINCAAIINLDYCEKNKKNTKKINVDLLKNIFLVKKKNKLNFKLIQISTDQMYNRKNNLPSRENSLTYIFNEYTKQKLQSEKICKKNRALILRLNFFSYEKKNFFHWICQSVLNNKKINLFKDIYFNPLSITSLTQIISTIVPIFLKNKVYGIYNLGSKDFISKSNFGVYIIKTLKRYKFTNYKLVKSDNFLKTKRPKNMRMNTSKFQNTFKIKLPSIKKELNMSIKKINVRI